MRLSFQVFILVFSAILTSCNLQSVQAPKPTTQPAASSSSGCTMGLLQELKHTSNGIGITTLENLEINLRALQGYWEEMDTQNECEQTIRGYMLEFFDDALQKD